MFIIIYTTNGKISGLGYTQVAANDNAEAREAFKKFATEEVGAFKNIDIGKFVPLMYIEVSTFCLDE